MASSDGLGIFCISIKCDYRGEDIPKFKTLSREFKMDFERVHSGRDVFVSFLKGSSLWKMPSLNSVETLFTMCLWKQVRKQGIDYQLKIIAGVIEVGVTHQLKR
jgi:hypothetical protein